MESWQPYMMEYKKQMQKGDLRKAYQGLIEYLQSLRSYLQNKYPDYLVSGTLYQGYMDMSYFSFSPGSFKSRNLKVAIVFIHETCRFEVWLAGVNKQIQKKYWQWFKDKGWKKYRLPTATKGVDSIIEGTLSENPNFGDLDKLTQEIERGTFKFIHDVEKFLSSSGP